MLLGSVKVHGHILGSTYLVVFIGAKLATLKTSGGLGTNQNYYGDQSDAKKSSVTGAYRN